MFNNPSTHSAKSRRWILSTQKCFQRSLCCLLQIIHTTDVEFSHPESYASLILSIWQETDLKHADSMMPFALPVIANLQQKWVTSSEIWWSCPILCCGSVPKWWVNAFTDSEKKSLELLVAHRRSCSTALFNCFRGSIMVSFPNGSCHLHQCSFAWSSVMLTFLFFLF